MTNQIARKLRKTMTPQEVKLWVQLRHLKEQGHNFRRQVPKGPLIVDFAEQSARMVIELDGSQHAEDGPALKDAERDKYLANKGFDVLRFWNHEVDKAMDSVIEKLWKDYRNPTPAVPADPPHKLGREKNRGPTCPTSSH
jgi:very-short-patch-repair endonuclease